MLHRQLTTFLREAIGSCNAARDLPATIGTSAVPHLLWRDQPHLSGVVRTTLAIAPA